MSKQEATVYGRVPCSVKREKLEMLFDQLGSYLTWTKDALSM